LAALSSSFGFVHAEVILDRGANLHADLSFHFTSHNPSIQKEYAKSRSEHSYNEEHIEVPRRGSWGNPFLHTSLLVLNSQPITHESFHCGFVSEWNDLFIDCK
jgi:hypothetical protein